jgi:hypothetical protein
MVFGLISSFIPLVLLGAIVYAIVKAVSRRDEPAGSEAAPGAVRRLFLFATLYGAVHFAAWGSAGLLAQLSDRSGQVAEPLAITLVSVPVAVLLARWAWRTIADPAERGLALSAYLSLTLSTALIVAMITGFRVGTWLLTDDGLSEFALAALLVWSAVWAIHWLAWKRYESEIGNAHVFFGAAAGLVTAAVAGAILLTGTLQWLLDTGTAVDLTSFEADDFARSIIGLTVGGIVLVWYWFANGLQAQRDPIWHGYVVLVGVLGGLITAVTGAGVAGFGVLQWWWGEPDAVSAVRHFNDFVPAVAALAVGSLAWIYHRLVVLGGIPEERTEVHRVYDYVVAAVGLVTAAVGSVLLLVGLQEALFPPEDDGRFESSINIILGAGTALAVGGPLWFQAWRRARRYARGGLEQEVSSPTRRVYLFGVLGVSGIVGFGSLVTLLVAVFNALFEENGGLLRDDVQVPVALLITVGAVAAYHWRTMRAERGLIVAPAPVKDIMLVTGDRELASLVHDLTGARVRVLHRLDGDGDLLDPAAVARAIDADEHERLLVLSGPRGAVDVIPYDG